MSDALPAELLDHLCRLAGTLPEGIARELTAAIREAGTVADREEVLNRLHPRLLPDNRGLFSEFGIAWRQSSVNISGAEVAAALEAASFQGQRQRETSSVELVWTGPSTLNAGMRGTEQVILDMISRAKHSIYIVTFAAYRVETVACALHDAITRNVRVVLVLEDKDESDGKVNFNALTALAGGNLQALKVYVWPLEQRKRNDRGQNGTLHAKCVLVDGERLFVSSANMTSFALELNIELGVLLNGGEAPMQMEKNLTELIRTGVLREHKTDH
ncbi:MAG: DISARM system phospholipase D-like protein DrmC [Burkholderiales bacterium]